MCRACLFLGIKSVWQNVACCAASPCRTPVLPASTCFAIGLLQDALGMQKADSAIKQILDISSRVAFLYRLTAQNPLLYGDKRKTFGSVFSCLSLQ
jgi:hypothetical protein